MNAGISAVVVLAVMALVFRFFPQYGKSNVWYFDGMGTHFPSLYYFNLWIRSIVSHPANGIPLWSWNLGLGADIISTLAWTVVGDPTALISLLFPMKYIEYAYSALFLIRLLLVGGASVLYFRKMQVKPVAALAGALVCMFGTFVLFLGLRHYYFVNPMIYLPLMLIGVEQVLRRQRPYFLIIIVGVAASSNFYFFYMLTILVVLYAIARYFQMTPREDYWRRLLPQAARVAGPYTLGTMLAAVILIPVAMAVSGSSRAHVGNSIGLFYSVMEYSGYLAALGSSVIASNSTMSGFSPVALMLLPVLFMRRAQHSATKFMLVLFPLAAALPLLGSLFNGFTFPNNRFVFGWGLFVGLGAALVLSDEKPFTRRELMGTLAAYVIYTGAVLVLWKPMTLNVGIALGIGALGWGVMALEAGISSSLDSMSPLVRSGVFADWRMPATRWALMGLLVVGIIANATTLYDTRYSKLLGEYEDIGSVLKQFQQNPGSLAGGLPKGGSYRVEKQEYVLRDNNGVLASNDPLVQKYRGTSFYFSVMNGYLFDYLNELDIRSTWFSFAYDGFDDRAIPMALAGVKYYIGKPGLLNYIPRGFMEYEKKGGSRIYENAQALPLGFVYDTVVRRSDYQSLSPLDKQGALLQGAVVDDSAAGNLPTVVPTPSSVDVTYSVIGSVGATFDRKANTIVTIKRGAKLKLGFAPVTGSELYVYLKDLNQTSESPADRAARALGDSPSKPQGVEFQQKTESMTPSLQYYVTYSAGGAPKTARWDRPGFPYAWGDTAQLVNLGYKRSGFSSVTIGIDEPGTLKFTSLQVLAVPLQTYPQRIAQLNRSPLRDIKLGTNTVTGKVTAARDGILYLSIPYSSGWTASIDGRPVETLRVNTAFTGVRVSKGEHSVVLRYFTPGLKAGITISGLAVLTLLALIGVLEWRRRRPTPSPSP